MRSGQEYAGAYAGGVKMSKQRRTKIELVRDMLGLILKKGLRMIFPKTKN
ncbi:hypothetical protein C5S39_13835 [Candidatus Methanophagaceae archaeon]|nr:hypothetical protein C5S39_13835 [Methanophagales archaeon]